MSALETADSVAEAIRPTLDAFAAKAESTCRKVAEQIYEELLYSVQDYLRENAEWNIGQEIARCRAIEHDNFQLRHINQKLLEGLQYLDNGGILATAESNASGTPEWERISWRINAARAAISLATGAA